MTVLKYLRDHPMATFTTIASTLREEQGHVYKGYLENTPKATTKCLALMIKAGFITDEGLNSETPCRFKMAKTGQLALHPALPRLPAEALQDLRSEINQSSYFLAHPEKLYEDHFVFWLALQALAEEIACDPGKSDATRCNEILEEVRRLKRVVLLMAAAHGEHKQKGLGR